MKQQNDYVECVPKGKTRTLVDDTSEVRAKMFVKAADDLEIVDVDRGVISESQHTKKCDFLILGTQTRNTHLIELKGTNIDAAFEQIERTIDFLNANPQCEDWVKNREVTDSYIVSPERQKIPNVHSEAEKKLAKKLAKHNRNKVKDIFQLIYFVRNVNSQKRLSRNGRQVISSGSAPVELN